MLMSKSEDSWLRMNIDASKQPKKEKEKSNKINEFIDEIIEWRKNKGFETSYSNLPLKVMLIITELGRAVDAHRENDHDLIYHELTDALIRLFDLMGSIGMNVEK